ncbi:MAG: polysaccharide deacetylase family protein [Pelagibacterales bacterium]|nr:polysaccharide deacetylase family protein [Pelagibacterales bacterium]
MNILGIDFEDWFHPELIQKHISKKNNEPKVVEGIHKILELLRQRETTATFFVVGELLEYKPELIDLILENDHEIAFHTMKHTRIDSLNFKDEFNVEIKKFDKLTNGKSKGFRAPSFSLNMKSSWLIDILEENNYIYDSSVVPAKTNLYGMPNADTKPYKISSKCLESNSDNAKILEFPLLVTKFLGKKLPAAGGFFLRTLPSRVIENAIKSYEKQKIPGVFYIHSWELTPEFMPKIELPKKDHFITFHNINKAYGKMENLLKNFEFTSFSNFIQVNKEKLY